MGKDMKIIGNYSWKVETDKYTLILIHGIII